MYYRIRDPSFLGIAVVPTHGRRERKPFSAHDPESPLRSPVAVCGLESDTVLPLHGSSPGDEAGPGINPERGGQSSGREYNRTVAGTRNPVEERIPWTATVHDRAVNPGGGPGQGGQNVDGADGNL